MKGGGPAGRLRGLFAGRLPVAGHHAARALDSTASCLYVFLLGTQKEPKRCPLLPNAREARLKGYSPLRIPKWGSAGTKAKKCRNDCIFLNAFVPSSGLAPLGPKYSVWVLRMAPSERGLPPQAGGGETKRQAAVYLSVSPSVSFADSSLAEGASSKALLL